MTCHLAAVPHSWTTVRARRLVAGCACAGLYIANVCGWAAFATIFQADGIFADGCGNEVPCAAQDEAFLVIYSAAVAAMSLSGTLAGLLCDRMPPIWGVSTAGACIVLGCLAIGLLPSSSGFWFLPATVLFAVGGNTTFFAATKQAFLFPSSQRPAILSVVCGLYDASTAISLVFLVAFHAGFSRADIFVAHAALAAVLYGTWAAASLEPLASAATKPTADLIAAPSAESATKLATKPATALPSRLHALKQPLLSAQAHGSSAAARSRVESSARASSPSAQGDAGSSGAADAEREAVGAEAVGAEAVGAEAVGAEAVGPASRRLPPLHEATLGEQLRSLQLLVGFVWYLISQQRCNLYLGTARAVLLQRGDDGVYMAMHTALLPAGLLFVPALACAHRRLGVLGSMQLVTLMGGVHGLLVLGLPLGWQPLTFLLFACYRVAVFATFSIYTSEAFGPQASGTLTGAIFFLGGLGTLALVPVGLLVDERLGGDWDAVYWVFTLLTLPKLGLVWGATRYWAEAEASRDAPLSAPPSARRSWHRHTRTSHEVFDE